MEVCHTSPNVAKRKQMYKCHSPAWKQTYRQRCHERLQGSRQKFLERFRTASCQLDDKAESMVQDLMVDEWKKLHQQQQHLPVLSEGTTDFDFQNLGNENLDEVLSILDEIKAELLKEEQQIIREYEAGLEFDDAVFGASVEGLTTNTVICPVCEKNPLWLHKAVIFCRCGIRIDTEQDCISLDFAKQNLQDGLTMHSDSCHEKPVFSVVNQVGIDNLLMTCQILDRQGPRQGYILILRQYKQL